MSVPSERLSIQLACRIRCGGTHSRGSGYSRHEVLGLAKTSSEDHPADLPTHITALRITQ